MARTPADALSDPMPMQLEPTQDPGRENLSQAYNKLLKFFYKGLS
jgi:hypothetical protein